MKVKYIVAIDPSVNKSGICTYNIPTKEIESLESKRLWEVFQDISLHDSTCVHFFVENSNAIKGNWHGKTARGNVGKNKGISQNIIDYLEEINASYTELKPKGYSKKFNDVEIFKQVTNCELRSNKDNRAAAAMIYFNKMLVRKLTNK